MTQSSQQIVEIWTLIKAKFHYVSWFEAGSSGNLAYHLACYSSELARASRFTAKFHYAIWFKAGCRPASNLSATSFEPDSVMEFGCKQSVFVTCI